MKYKDTIACLKKATENIYLIHYSCQSLGDDNEGYSPRISGIAVTCYETACTHSFALHLKAERKGINKENIEAHYDELEKDLLSDFWSFMKKKIQCYWVHWNMNNSTYGFEVLAHRYNVLTGKDAPILDDGKKYNLSNLVMERYGAKCLNDPKMKNLMTLNGGLHRDFLDGEQENKALENLQFNRLHKSTITKTCFYSCILKKLITQKRVKTNRNNFKEQIDIILEHPVSKICGLISVIFNFVIGILFFFEKIW